MIFDIFLFSLLLLFRFLIRLRKEVFFVSKLGINRYFAVLERLVYFAGVEPEGLQIGYFSFIGFESGIDLAGQGSVCLIGQHNSQQIYEQFRILVSLYDLEGSV